MRRGRSNQENTIVAAASLYYSEDLRIEPFSPVAF